MVQIACRIAESRTELDDALRVRWAVFGDELGLLPARIAQRDVDQFDTLETTIHVVAYADGAAVATGRLVLPNRDVACARGFGLGLDVEDRFHLDGLSGAGMVVAEVTRVCVLRPFRFGHVTLALLVALFKEGQRRGVTHCVAAVNTETDVAEDAQIIARVIEHRGLVSPKYRLSPRTRSAPVDGARAPFYDLAERRRAAAGDLTGLRLPQPVAAFTRFGLRLVGSTEYDPRFLRFAVPLVGTVDEMQIGTALHIAA